MATIEVPIPTIHHTNDPELLVSHTNTLYVHADEDRQSDYYYRQPTKTKGKTTTKTTTVCPPSTVPCALETQTAIADKTVISLAGARQAFDTFAYA